MRPRRRFRPSEIESRIAARNAARQAKDFKESDRIRDELADNGRGAEGLQGRHHLGGRAMMARANPHLRAAAVSAAGRADAGGDFPRQRRGTDRGRLQPGAAGGLGVARRRHGGVRRAARQAPDPDRHHEGSPVGFISLDAPTEIGLFYVHPAVAGQGVGTMLYDAVEKLSAARGDAAPVGRRQRHRARVLRAHAALPPSSATPSRSATSG